MAIGKLWAGRTYGTHIGNLFLKLDGPDEQLTGILRFSAGQTGVILFEVSGGFDGQMLRVEGPEVPTSTVTGAGRIKAAVCLDSAGVLRGEWETSVGAGGILELHPHDIHQQNRALVGEAPPQLFSARHEFGAVSLDKAGILDIAEAVQREFSKGLVTVSVLGTTEQVLFLDAFRSRDFRHGKTNVVRIFAREPQEDNLDRSVTIELGPHVNFLSTQSGVESWVLGVREKLKSEVSRFERSYATNFKKLNVGINQLLIIAAVVYLPSLSELRDRAILMSGVLLIAAGLKLFHDKYLPHAELHAANRPQSLLSRIGPTIVSWIVSVTGGAAATMLALYLQGWLKVP